MSSITVVLKFIPKNGSGNTLHSAVENHAEVYNWANSIQHQYIGAKFNVIVEECYTGSNALWDEDNVGTNNKRG